MKNKIFLISLIFLILTGCVGISSKGVFGTGVSIAFDPRSLGTQIDDSVMQKNLAARLALKDKSYILTVSTKVLDGKIFVTGKVEEPEEKLQITKLAWETKGARSVKNDIKIKEKNSSIMLKESDKKNVQKLIKKLSIKDITDLISQNTNVSKKEIYNYCLKIKNEK